jgi:hypothetical protein
MREDPPLTTVVTAAAITLIALTGGLRLLGEEPWTAIGLALGVTIIGATVGWSSGRPRLGPDQRAPRRRQSPRAAPTSRGWSPIPALVPSSGIANRSIIAIKRGRGASFVLRSIDRLSIPSSRIAHQNLVNRPVQAVLDRRDPAFTGTVRPLEIRT